MMFVQLAAVATLAVPREPSLIGVVAILQQAPYRDFPSASPVTEHAVNGQSVNSRSGWAR